MGEYEGEHKDVLDSTLAVFIKCLQIRADCMDLIAQGQIQTQSALNELCSRDAEYRYLG